MQYSIVCLIVGAQWMVCSVLVFVDLVPEPSAALPESGNNLREDIILCLLETIMLSCIAREKLYVLQRFADLTQSANISHTKTIYYRKLY